MITTERNKDLTALNTFGMRVRAALYVEYDSAEDLGIIFGNDADAAAARAALGLPEVMPAPYLQMGGGSNLLFTGDFPGTVFHSAIKYISIVDDGACAGKACGDKPSSIVKVEAGAGVVFDDFCAWAAAEGLWGAENLSYIPGEAGASAVQNIGAYGVEVKDIISEVRCFDTVLLKEVAFKGGECGYGYRDSLFKRDRKGRYIVTSVLFGLSREPKPVLDYGHIREALAERLRSDGQAADASELSPETLSPQLIREVITAIRKTKLPEPSELGSAGSFFKNPVVPKSAYDKVEALAKHYSGEETKVPHYDLGSGFVKIPAAWLIEQCGWKGHVEGNAGVYAGQPLVLVNLTGEAGPEEIVMLEEKIISSVKEKFDIDLEPEVEHV